MLNQLEYRRIDTREGLASLGSQWAELDAQQVQPLLPLSHLWHLAWWDSFGANFKLALGAVLSNDKLVAIAPLYSTNVRERGLCLATTELASNGYSPFSDILLAPNLTTSRVDEVLELLVVNNPCDVMRLRKLPADGIVAKRASQVDGLDLTIGVETSLKTPIISFAGDWQGYLKQLSSSTRKTLRRRLKFLDSRDELEVQQYKVQSSTDPVLDDVVAVSSRSWKVETKTDLANDQAGREFVWRLIDDLGLKNDVVVWVLHSNGQPVAFELLLHYGGIVYPIRADYDQAFASLSPGSVLMAHVLKNMFETGVAHTYDCCGDNYAYLRSLTKQTRQYIDVELFSPGLRPAMAYAMKYQLAPMVRTLSRQTRNVARLVAPAKTWF